MNSTTLSCKPYPSDLRSLEECCEVPVLFDVNVKRSCEHICLDVKAADQNCVIECLFRNNGLMKNNEINKTALAHTFDKFGLGDPEWRNITREAIDECWLEHNESKSFQDIFEEFEKCMNKFYLEHCVEGKEPVECDKVSEFMEECQNIAADCLTWPKWIVKLPEYCCDNRPELFSKEIKTKADLYCAPQSIPSNLGQMQCLATFMINVTGIKFDGKWDFTIAKDFLIDHSRNDEKWKTAIEKTIETCEKQVHGK